MTDVGAFLFIQLVMWNSIFHLLLLYIYMDIFDSKVHGANMGPIWGRQDPGWPHVVPMNFAIWDVNSTANKSRCVKNIFIILPSSSGQLNSLYLRIFYLIHETKFIKGLTSTRSI